MGWFKTLKQANEDEKEYQRLKAESRSRNASRAGSVTSRNGSRAGSVTSRKSSAANSPRKSSAVKSARRSSATKSPRKSSPVKSARRSSATNSPQKSSGAKSPRRSSAADSSRRSSAANSVRRSTDVVFTQEPSEQSSRQQPSGSITFQRWSDPTSRRPSITRRHRDHSRSTGTQTPKRPSQRNDSSADEGKRATSREAGRKTTNTSANRPPLSPRTQPVSLQMSTNSLRSPRRSTTSPPFSASDSPVRRSPITSQDHSSYTALTTSPQRTSLMLSNTQVPRSQRERVVSFEAAENDDDIEPYSQMDTSRTQLTSSTNTQPPRGPPQGLVFLSSGTGFVRYPTTRPRHSTRPSVHARGISDGQFAQERSFDAFDAPPPERAAHKTDAETQTSGPYLPYGPPKSKRESSAAGRDPMNDSTSSLAPSRQKLNRPIVAPLYSYLGTSQRPSVVSRPRHHSLSQPPRSPPKRTISRSHVDPHSYNSIDGDSYVELVGVLRQHESGSLSRDYSPFNDDSVHMEAQDLLSGLWESAADYNAGNGSGSGKRIQQRSIAVPPLHQNGITDRRDTSPLQLRKQRNEWEGSGVHGSIMSTQETPMRSPLPTDWTASTVRADQLGDDGNSPWPRWTSPSQQQQQQQQSRDLVRSPSQQNGPYGNEYDGRSNGAGNRNVNPYNRPYGNGYAAPYAMNTPYA